MITQFHDVLVFLSQGFHFRQHPLQTLFTLFLGTGLVGFLTSLILSIVDGIRVWRNLRRNAAYISTSEWAEVYETFRRGPVTVVAAVALANGANEFARAAHSAVAQVQQDGNTVAASVNDLNKRIDGIDARLQRLETAPVPQVDTQGALIPADFKAFQLEVSNTLDGLREEIRAFREDFEGRLVTLEVEDSEFAEAKAAITEALPLVQAAIRVKKTKAKVAKRKKR